MTTTLVLVRHGETVLHAENRYAGSSDVPLTEHGKTQAIGLAQWAGSAGLDAIYSSTLSRTMDTARPSTATTALPLATDARLCEVDFGDGERMTQAEMREAFPDALAAFLSAPARNPFPRGEPGTAAIARAMPAMEDIVERHEGGRVLIVMHSTLLRLLLCTAIGLDPDSYRRVFPTVHNCALNTVRFGGAGPALLGFNVPALSATTRP